MSSLRTEGVLSRLAGMLLLATGMVYCAGGDPTLVSSGGEGAEAPDSGTEVNFGSAGGAGSTTSDDPSDASFKPVYPDVTFNYDAGEDPGLNADSACAAARFEATRLPLDLYILLDRSGSMNLPQSLPFEDQTPGGGDCDVGDDKSSRWCHAINALDGFFGEASDVEAGVALQFFPGGGCTGSSNPFVYACCNSGTCCQGTTDAVPAVPMGDLPDHRAALVQALNAEIPWGDRTPIQAALRGIVAYTANNQREGRYMAGLIITDGSPEGCSANKTTLANIAKNHLQATGIKTFAIGMQGADFATLDAIAQAGGAALHDDHCAGSAASCYYYDVGSGGPSAFSSVLEKIQTETMGCEFEMPVPDQGIINPNEVSLEYVGAASQAVRVTPVASPNACGNGDGFYFDDAENPTRISLCPTTCGKVTGGGSSEVEVLVGCLGS